MFQLRQVVSLSCHDRLAKFFKSSLFQLNLCNFGVIVMEIFVLYFSHNYARGFVTNCQRGRLLGSYFLCNWLIL